MGIETAFQRGGFGLAHALQRPILPIAMTGSHRVWEYPFGPRLRRGERISVRVLPPIPFSELQRRGIEEVRRSLQRQIKAAALDGTMVEPRRFVPARDGYWDGYAYGIDPAFPNLMTDVSIHRTQRANASDFAANGRR